MTYMLNEQKNRINVVFFSSSIVNLAKLYAENNSESDVFLIIDRKVPFNIEDDNLDNFYSYSFDKNKMYEKDRNAYFDNLGVFIERFSPDLIICNNFGKLIPMSFIEFMKFRNPKLNILNIHHGDLREKLSGKMKYEGLNSDMKELLFDEKIITTIHKIEDEGMDTGEHLAYSHETTLKELKQKGLINKKEEVLNLRLRNVILSYHERTKVLKLLRKVIDEF